MVFEPTSSINLDRYPILDLASPHAKAVIDEARRSLVDHGYAELPQFVQSNFVEALRVDAESLVERSHRSQGLGTAYLGAPDLTVDETHPLRRTMPYGVRAVGYDAIPLSSPLRQLYEFEPLTRFIEAAVNRGHLYPYGDPFGALNLSVMAEGDELQWHYDQTDFVVSLAIQPSDAGGSFDVVPLMRNSNDEHFAAVKALFDGDESSVVTLPMTPGTLLIFEGRNSIHRVSPIGGSSYRHVGLLAYDTVEGRQGSATLRQTRYGRTEPFPTPPHTWRQP